MSFVSGVGSSNIYSLLTLRTRPSWLMFGNDIDVTNLEYARKNTISNGLQSRMRLLKSIPAGPLIPLSPLEVDHLDFTMCNPPFFSSAAEMRSSLTGESKSRPPSAVCTGAEVEMVTEGGDLGFALRMLQESLKLRDKVQWYTIMLGKLASANELVGHLKQAGVRNWAVGVLRANSEKTKRWTVGWSFGACRPPDVSRMPAL